MGDGVMIKLRLDYLLMRGVTPIKGDTYELDCACHLVVEGGIPTEYCSHLLMRSFAPRKNNGSQPVPDDFPVVSLNGWRLLAEYVNWAIKPSWKPDIDKLIEQQIEYDKAKLKEQFKNGPQGVVEGLEQPIEELMINAKGNNMPIYTQEMKDAGKYAPIGSKVRIANTSSFDLEYGDDILGLEVTVKSGPISIGKGNIIQVVEYENIAYCFETDMIFPFKSQEEIETEEAKEKQISKLCERYPHVKVKLFIDMQNNGDLAEIILPLEDK